MGRKIALIIPTQNIGGMERVISELANCFAANFGLDVYLIKLVSGVNSFYLHPNIKILEPEYDYKQINPFINIIKTGIYLRRSIKQIMPDSILAFGDRYNAYSILFTIGLNKQVFISNRMSPLESNGCLIDLLNTLLYPHAAGLIAQTNFAKEIFEKRYKLKNVKVIGNPIRQLNESSPQLEKQTIINVGRFNDKKNQELLINFFAKINPDGWNLVFVGEGPKKGKAEALVKQLGLENKISFLNNGNIEQLLNNASIFAFTSTSEGFPNALGEALSHGLACISFDCVAGPGDLIDHNINGYLVPVERHDLYVRYLSDLINNLSKRQQFSNKAMLKMKFFSIEGIGRKYIDFILK